MKRWIPLILSILLLAGCGKKGGVDTSHITTYPDGMGADYPQLYQPDSQMEKDTAGAVREYKLSETVSGICQAGGGVGLIGENTLSIVQGENGSVTGTYDRTEDLIFTTDGAVLGYDPQTRTLSYLGSSADAAQGWTLPETAEGVPLVSRTANEIYYCVPGQVLALNMQTGITRRVLEHSQVGLSLKNLCFGDSVLGIQTESGVRYVRTENGQSVCDDAGLLELESVGDAYFAQYREGTETVWIFGTVQQPAQQLCISQPFAVPALAAQGAAAWDDTGALSYYDLTTGKKTAQVTLPGKPTAVLAEGAAFWILMEQSLYRWDPALSPVSEDEIWIAPMYTAQAPDTAGLALCQERVDQMNKDYGVQITIWEDAVKVPGEHLLTGEYQVPRIQDLLDQLEPLLAQFPQNFIKNTVKAGAVRLNLVRTADGGQPFIQYWAEGDCHIALTPGCDVQEAFYTGLGWGVDSHILGNSRDLEYWNDLNPKGFDYDYDYEKNAVREDTYLSEGTRYFVDKRAMSYPSEDRARTFYFALMPGNEELFQIPTLQKKLRVLCEGIREAYSLEKYETALPWEVYLAQPLYPQK